MKYILVLFLLVSTFTAHAGDFSLIDQNGVQHQMSWYARTPNAQIILVSYSGDPELRNMVEDLQQQMTQTYFFFIYPGNNRDLESSIPILMDDTKLVTESFGFYAEGHAVQLNTKDLTRASDPDFMFVHNHDIDPQFVREKQYQIM